MRIGIILLLSVFTLSLMAQSPDLLRLELNARMSEDTYEVVPCGEDGVVIFYEGAESGNTANSWHFALFNDQLQEAWITDTSLIPGIEYKDHSMAGGKLYLLFHLPGKSREEDPNMQILELGIADGKKRINTFSVEDKASVAGFLVAKDHAVAGLNLKKETGRMVFVNLLSGDVFEHPVGVEDQSHIQDIVLDTLGHTVYASIQQYDSREQQDMYIGRYSLTGNETGTVKIKPVLAKKYLNNAHILPLGREVYIMGTYNWYRNRIGGSDETGYPKSTGYYIAKFARDKQIFINYYNFLEFHNLYNSFSGDEIVRIRKRAQKQHKKDEEYSLDYTVILHEPVFHNGHLIMLAEAFYPEYRTVSNMYYDYYGRMVPQSYTVFDGYKFFNGIVAAFDREGRMQWDNDMEIWNLLTFDLERHLEIYPAGKETALLYNLNGQLHYKVFGKGSEYDFSGVEDTEIMLKRGKDRLIDDARSKVVHWYDNFFLAYGYHEVRNSSMAENRRTVFYLNKIAFQ